MGEKLLKPYEISVWEDTLTQIEGSEPAEYKFVETKLAIIGSDTMTGLNKVYDPVFHKKSNGEKTLSFSLKYKYFDPFSENEQVVNPFVSMLVNERKIKLHYDNEWYEFIIKDHSESSDGLEWTYTCTDAFVLELSKNGYNITFDTQLNNNQGTAKALAKETLKNTDWRVGENSDTLTQLVSEPIYQAVLQSVEGIEIINASGNSDEVPGAGAEIYLFYSYVKNKNGQNVQFIIRDKDRKYTIDDKNVITDTNFRITTELEFKDNGFYLDDTQIISIGAAETKFQANRLVYNQLTTYDPIMQRTVDRFQTEDGSTEIFKYTDYEYTTSNVVMNYITNGENFNALEDGTLQGWNPYTDQINEEKVNKLELVTRPEIGTGKTLADIGTLSQIEGFLKIQPNGIKVESGDKIYNTVYNSGIENNGRLIESIAQGQEFVFRWRAGEGKDVESLTSKQSLGLIVAKYTQDSPTRFGYYYKHIDPKDIILKFEGEPQILNNYVTGGSIEIAEDGTQVYIIDDVVQTPSTKYIYTNLTDGENYLWNGKLGVFEKESSVENYLPYYYLTAKAQVPISNSVLIDPTTKIGIFVYATEVTTYTVVDEETQETKEEITPIYIQDIQLTRLVPDSNNNPVLIGNIPTATSNSKSYYYIKPVDGTAAENVNTYTDLNELKKENGITADVIPLYNENSEKNLTISASQSNCFNILQTIAETFECWIDLVVGHDDEGYITYDDNGKPNKYVYLREYIGEDNWAGFKYGINLDTIERTVNSDEIVTKLIVDSSQSEYVDEGYVSITSAPSNQSGESYIVNFDYYYSQNLLNREETEADRLNFITKAADLNQQLQDKEKDRRDLESSLTALGSKRNVYTELIDTAKDTKNKAMGDFLNLTGMSYEDYQKKHGELIEDESENEKEKQLTDEQTIVDIIGEIYVTSATINNYSGILSNIDTEYRQVRKQLYGSEKHTVTVSVVIDADEIRHIIVELDDYLPGFSFLLENDETSYESTVSKRYFDISPTSATTITFTAPAEYTVVSGAQTINDLEVAHYDINPVQEIDGIEDEINKLQAEKNELVNSFNNKYSRYIQEGTWNSTDYIDSELYYLDALQVSNTSAQPVVSYTINVVEISELEGFEGYKFDVGEKTYVEDTEFFGWNVDNLGDEENPNYVYTPAREEVIVAEIEWHLDEPDQNVITVQNYKTRFEDLFQRVSATVQTVQYNEATYAKISSLMDANGTINQNVLLNSLNNISGKGYSLTSDGSVIIDEDRILVRNLTNPANRVIINSEGIRVSSDGGQNWTTAIDGQGINIGTVYTGTLNTNNVVIGNEENPSFRWDKSGISAFKADGTTTIDGQTIQKYDLQTYVRFDEYGLYGIKDNASFKAQNLDEVLENAHFAVTWDGFFIKNSYEGGGRVSLTSGNDFQVINSVNGQENEKIKIGALEWKDKNGNITTDPEQGVGAPELYGIRIKNDDGAEVMKTDDEGNLVITGTLNANAGNFDGLVTVGKDDNDVSKPYIEIDGRDANDATIRSSRYTSQDGKPYGWMINADGDAVFNNITARGAIKTAVFEYAEIQAVGGVFIFRPSSTIRSAAVSGDNLILTVEKSVLFKNGQWCKVSNYASGSSTEDGEAINPDTTDILLNNGLAHIYPISRTQGSNAITLVGGAAMVKGADRVVDSVDELIGGALVDMGNQTEDPVTHKIGTSNYGIGINSSDNTIDLPARAISLFETVVDETKNPKVSYNYRGILGTLPTMGNEVNQQVYSNMVGTQGIYTDNMYIGDQNQYLAFYEDENGDKHLKISAREMIFGYDSDTGQEITWEDKIDEATQGTDAAQVVLTSTIGDQLVDSTGRGAVYARVFVGGAEVDPLKTEVFDFGPPISGEYYYHLDATNKTCVLKKKVNDVWVTAPIEDQPIYTYTWTFRDKNGQPKQYDGMDSITDKAIYFDASLVDDKLVILCDVSDS